MSKNMQRLGATLSDRMKLTASGAVPTTIELGTVNSNLSLTTDSLQAAIPKGDYMVNLMLTGDRSTSTESHTHTDGYHSHSHELPGTFRGLSAGDRVLVSWCGNEPVVIAIVTASTTLSFSQPDQDEPSGDDSSDPGSGSGSSGGGTSGADGKDGVSPTVTVTPIEGGNRVTITDVDGPKTFDVMDGTTPVKGKDYFTAEEVEAIVQDVVKRVTALFEDKFYTKTEIDKKLDIATDEEISDMLDEFYGEDESAV